MSNGRTPAGDKRPGSPSRGIQPKRHATGQVAVSGLKPNIFSKASVTPEFLAAAAWTVATCASPTTPAQWILDQLWQHNLEFDVGRGWTSDFRRDYAYYCDYQRAQFAHVGGVYSPVASAAGECNLHRCASQLSGSHGSWTREDDVPVESPVETILELVRSGRVTPAEGDRMLELALAEVPTATPVEESPAMADSDKEKPQSVLVPNGDHLAALEAFKRQSNFVGVAHRPLYRPEPGMNKVSRPVKWRSTQLSGGWPRGSYTGDDDMPRKNQTKGKPAERSAPQVVYRAPPNATKEDLAKLVSSRLASGASHASIASEVARVASASANLKPKAPKPKPPAPPLRSTMRDTTKKIASAVMTGMGVPSAAANGLVDLGERVYDHLRTSLSIKGRGDYVVSNYNPGTTAAETPNTLYPHKSQYVSSSTLQGLRLTVRQPYGAVVAASGTNAFGIDVNPANSRDERIAALAAIYRRYRVRGMVVNFVSDVSGYAASGVLPAMAIGCDASGVTTLTPSSLWQVNEMASAVYAAANKDILFGSECAADVEYVVDDGTGLHPPEALRPSMVWVAYTSGTITSGLEMGQMMVYVDYEFLEQVIPDVPYGCLKAYSNTGVTNSTPLGSGWYLKVYKGVGQVLITSTTITFLSLSPGSTVLVSLYWNGGSASVSAPAPTVSNGTITAMFKYTTSYQVSYQSYPSSGASDRLAFIIPVTAATTVGPSQYPVLTLGTAGVLPTSPYLDIVISPISSSGTTTAGTL